MKIFSTPEFDEWFLEQTEKHKQQIRARLRNIELWGHFGSHKMISDVVWELKWENGRRVYYTYEQGSIILLLFGGNKNGQNKDIANAKKIYDKSQ